MKLVSYNSDSVFEALRSEWNVLLERSTANRVFSTWEWQSTWWNSYQPGTLYVITVRDDEGRLIGIAPWFVENHPLFGRVVRAIGCVEVTDYLDLIVDTSYQESVLRAITEFARDNHGTFDVIDMCNLPEGSPGHILLPQLLNQSGFSVEIKEQEVCPVIDLPSDWETYLESLDKKQRHEIRRKLRRIESASEGVGWYIVGHEHDLDLELHRFLELMAASQAQKASFLRDEKNKAFIRSVARIIFDQGWLQLSFLTVQEVRVAAYLNFVYGERVLVYNSGLASDLHAHLSPGIVLLAYNIRHAIESGHQVFDFLRGNEAYKYRMGGYDTRVFMLRARLETGQGMGEGERRNL